MSLQEIIGDISETSRRGSLEFEWKLENFFSLSEVVGDFYNSPDFSISSQSFYLRLYPNGDDDQSKGWISLYLVLGESCPPMDVQYSLAIKKVDGKTKELISETGEFSQEGDGWGFDEALERAELLRRRGELTSSDALTITATLKSGVPHPMEDSEIPTVGKLREGHCTQFCKEVFWEIDDVVRRLDEEEELDCKSPPYTFGTQQATISFFITDGCSAIGIYAPSSISGYLRWRAGILRADGKEEWTGSGETLLQEERPDEDLIGLWIGPSRCELIRQKDALISRGVLTFSVQISTQRSVEGATGMSVMNTDKDRVDDRCQELQPPEITDLTTLSRSLKDLYVAGKDCDVSLKVKEKTFGAHRLILGARTPVLAAMISDNLVEAENGVVRLEDCHPEAFQVFLLFVYSGVAEDLTSENVPDVYYMGDKYDLPELKEVCVQYMLSNLAVDSVCSILALASRHDEEVLLKTATEFSVENAREIFCTAAWSNFLLENTALANELIIQSHENVK